MCNGILSESIDENSYIVVDNIYIYICNFIQYFTVIFLNMKFKHDRVNVLRESKIRKIEKGIFYGGPVAIRFSFESYLVT